MLSGISWVSFFIGCIVSMFLYYSILYLLYQKKGASRNQQQMIKGEPIAFVPSNDTDLIKAIEVMIEQAYKNQSSQHELFFALQQILKNPSDHDPSIKIRIESAIQSKMKELDMPGFDADELVRLWKP